jgi:hypothetical protein
VAQRGLQEPPVEAEAKDYPELAVTPAQVEPQVRPEQRAVQVAKVCPV